MNHNISVVLLGAGKSNRFKKNILKQNVKIRKKKLIDYSREFFNKNFADSQIYVVINKKVNIYNIKKNETILHGSSTRFKSLFIAIEYLYSRNLQSRYTLIHDIARPILSISDIQKLIKSIKPGIYGSTLGYPITNAVKEVKGEIIKNNIIKDNLWSTFTPQLFRTDKLYESLINIKKYNYVIDDDIEALLLNNMACKIIKSSPGNIKVTYSDDIEIIKRLL